MNEGLPEILKIVLFSKNYEDLSKEEKLDAIKLAKASNKEEMFIAKLNHNYGVIYKLKQENLALDKLALEV